MGLEGISPFFPFSSFFAIFRSLGTTPISGQTLSEWKGHSRSSRRVPGYSRSSSRNWKFHSRNAKFHSRNGLSRLDQHETHNSRSNSRSDSRNCREPTRKIFIPPCILGAFFQELGWSPRTRNFLRLFFSRVSAHSPRTRAGNRNLLENGDFHSDPVCTDPAENFPSLVTRPEYPPISRDRCSNTPVALCFLWKRRLSLLHPHFFPY